MMTFRQKMMSQPASAGRGNSDDTRLCGRIAATYRRRPARTW
jgi:hypothetical protein